MRRFFVLAILPLLLCPCTSRAEAGSSGHSAKGAAVVREMNLARQHPEVYAGYLEKLRENFHGNLFVLPGGTRLRTREGVRAVDEAIRFLRRARQLSPLACSTGMSLAAAEHAADQASGAFGHAGSDRSNPAERMNRYGTWSGYWSENISYGKASARDIVIALIVDDGLRTRKHRNNIFNPAFNFAGAAIGPHARYRTVCSIDFAAGYAESGGDARSLFARN
ncbi:MAG: CAP domain-containing protein [Verrucomicrobiota bacterium]|nr:CAP domain-containing protein [Verrucomicrobiota bacterium]